MNTATRRLGIMLTVLGLQLVGCHASETDPQGQAEELADPVRRENAIFNLTKIYATTLADNKGDRAAEPVKALSDTIVGPLVDAYLNYPEDRQNGIQILNLLQEMQDVRAVSALIEALNWRTEVSEKHAICAAKTIEVIDVPDADKGKIIDALDKALAKISGNRPDDNKMRTGMIQALGSMHDKRATPILTRIATTQDETQNFLINRLAVQQVGELGDVGAVPDLIKSLFLFAPNNPGIRMNDVAAEALVRLGKPSLAPLLTVLKGNNKQANATAAAYIKAIKARRPDIAKEMSVRQVTSADAAYALGALGFSQALNPLLAESKSGDEVRRLNGAIALVRLNTTGADREAVRLALKSTYASMPKGFSGVRLKGQLVAAMAHTYDGGLFPFIREQIANRKHNPELRLIAAQNYALLAGREEAKSMQALIASEPSSENGGYKEKLKEHSTALKLAKECGKKIACWVDKVNNPDVATARKGAYMLGRFGVGNKSAIDALVGQLSNEELGVRLAALLALDRVATNGSKVAVDKINELRKAEQGRAVWTGFRTEALPIQARLRSRIRSN